LLQVTVDRADGVVNGWLALRLDPRELNAPEFADVVFEMLEVEWVE
jgi:hypothetical protein